jgi:hypothetical protein
MAKANPSRKPCTRTKRPCWISRGHLWVPSIGSANVTLTRQNGQQLFSSGCDNAARMYDMATGQSSQVAGHDAPIKCICYSDMPNGKGGNGVLITAGWDKKLKVGHPCRALQVLRDNRMPLLAMFTYLSVLGLTNAQPNSDCRPVRQGVRYGLRSDYPCELISLLLWLRRGLIALRSSAQRIDKSISTISTIPLRSSG